MYNDSLTSRQQFPNMHLLFKTPMQSLQQKKKKSQGGGCLCSKNLALSDAQYTLGCIQCGKLTYCKQRHD